MPTSPSRPPLYTVANYTPDDSIGALIHQVKLRMTQSMDERISDLDITTAQWLVLKHIAATDGQTASALCKGSGCDTGSMTRMLDRLEEKGLIRRERSTTDRRVQQLHLTDAGRALLPTLVPRVVDALNTLLTDFSEAELDTLKSMLRRMLRNLDGSKTPD